MLFWEFLQDNSLDWREVNLEKLSNFIHWLRNPNKSVVSIQPTVSHRSEKTINQCLTTVSSSNISDKVKQQLESLGIQLNSTLTKAIKSASEETVLDAIEALKEAISDGAVEKPGGWLKTAIEQGWKPNGKIQIKDRKSVV